MNLEYKCRRCGAEIEFYYDPNVSDKQHIQTILVQPCKICLEKTRNVAYLHGLQNDWVEDMRK